MLSFVCSKCASVSVLAAGVGCVYYLPTPLRHLRLPGCLHSTTRSNTRPVPAGCRLQRVLCCWMYSLGVYGIPQKRCGMEHVFRSSYVLQSFYCCLNSIDLRSRCMCSQGIPAHLPCTHSPRSHPPHTLRADVCQLDLSSHGPAPIVLDTARIGETAWTCLDSWYIVRSAPPFLSKLFPFYFIFHLGLVLFMPRLPLIV